MSRLLLCWIAFFVPLQIKPPTFSGGYFLPMLAQLLPLPPPLFLEDSFSPQLAQAFPFRPRSRPGTAAHGKCDPAHRQGVTTRCTSRCATSAATPRLSSTEAAGGTVTRCGRCRASTTGFRPHPGAPPPTYAAPPTARVREGSGARGEASPTGLASAPAGEGNGARGEVVRGWLCGWVGGVVVWK
eukprot:365504-Chlamydomonas_euryale.AAC.1